MAFLAECDEIVEAVIGLIMVNVMNIKSLAFAAAVLALIAIALLGCYCRRAKGGHTIRVNSTFPFWMTFSPHVIIFARLPCSFTRLTSSFLDFLSQSWNIAFTIRFVVLTYLALPIEKRKRLAASTNACLSLGITGLAQGILSSTINFSAYALAGTATSGAFEFSMHSRIIP